MNVVKTEQVKLKTRRTFLKQGTCSRTFFHIINRENNNPKPDQEKAIDTLAGGLVQNGYQCGMLWGAAMGAGTEAYKKYKDTEVATAVAIETTRKLIDSFVKKAKHIECEEITKSNFKSKWGIAKYLLSGKAFSCFNLAAKWAPDALEVTKQEINKNHLNQKALSCASEVIKQMGGTEEEQVMVAGFAGGLGLSGNGCGALSAAIWKTLHELTKKQDWKVSFPDPVSDKVIDRFLKVSDYEFECEKICKQKFNSIDKHSDFIRKGGCDKIINELAVI
jgi:hypothetical protein